MDNMIWLWPLVLVGLFHRFIWWLVAGGVETIWKNLPPACFIFWALYPTLYLFHMETLIDWEPLRAEIAGGNDAEIKTAITLTVSVVVFGFLQLVMYTAIFSGFCRYMGWA